MGIESSELQLDPNTSHQFCVSVVEERVVFITHGQSYQFPPKLQRRVEHYARWCINKRTGFKSKIVIFNQAVAHKLGERELEFFYSDEQNLHLTIHKQKPFKDVFAHSYLSKLVINQLRDVVLISEGEPFQLPGPRVVYVNDAFEHATGYKREEIIGKTPRILQCQETEKESRQVIATALREWRPFRTEIRNQKKNGELFDVELDISPVADETGWYIFWVSVQRDITDFKAKQRILENTQMLIESGNIGMWEESSEDRFYWDARSNNLHTGTHAPTSVSVDEWLSLIDENDRAPLRLLLTNIYSVNQTEQTYRLKLGHDNIQYLRITFVRKEGKCRGFVKDCSDVFKNESNYQTLLEHAPEGVVAIDADNIITFFSREAEKIWETDRKSVVGKHLNTIIPSNFKQVHNNYIEANRTTGINKIIGGYREIEIETILGNCKTALLYIAKQELDEGQFGYVAFVKDITEQKALQKILEEQQHNTITQTKLATMGELAARAGHEINNPVTIISAYLAKLRRGIVNHGVSKTELIDSLGVIESATDRIAEIVKSMKSVTSEQQPVQSEVIDLVKLVKRTFKTMTALINVHGEILRFENTEDELLVLASGTAIQQILVNLINNAYDAVKTESEPKITISIYRDENTVRVTVTDNGIGIDEDEQLKIFESFYTTKASHGGTGLGLALVRSLGESIGASVTVESTVGVGSTFAICLPLVTPEAESNVDTQTREDMQATNKPKNVIVVDDEADLSDIICEFMSGFGHSVLRFYSPKQALEYTAKNGLPDAIITDYTMPEMNGIEFLDIVSQQYPQHSVIKILMTGDINDYADRKSKVDYILQKPFPLNRLVELLEQI